MKKFYKLIALVLAIAMLAVSLCSCRALDEAKANRVFYSDDHTEILYNNSVYRLLLSGIPLMDTYGNSFSSVTDKDVPVLLKGFFGDYIIISEDETIIESFITISQISDMVDDLEPYYDATKSWADSVYYVREDRYDEVKEQGNPL